jgi:hypothetical protein
MTTSTHTPNRLERQLERLTEVPAFARPWFRNVVLRRAVPFTGTAGLAFVEMTTGRVEIGIRNEKKVQNHIGGVHASAMNLLAETATGMVVGMRDSDKGEVTVPVTVTDEAGVNPVECEFVWAWIPSGPRKS